MEFILRECKRSKRRRKEGEKEKRSVFSRSLEIVLRSHIEKFDFDVPILSKYLIVEIKHILHF